LLLLAIFFGGIFFSKPAAVSPVLVFNRPKVNIDIGTGSIFNSDQFKNLQPFVEIQTQYSYIATDKNNKQQTGFISASSPDQAKAVLEAEG